jgi:hypothetical protein
MTVNEAIGFPALAGVVRWVSIRPDLGQPAAE